MEDNRPITLADALPHIDVFEDAYQDALRLLATNAQRSDILACLVAGAEKGAGEGSVCSILLLDDHGLLRNGASPNLPADYLEAIDRLKPNSRVGTCAAAATTGLPVITSDFRSDDKWAEP